MRVLFLLMMMLYGAASAALPTALTDRIYRGSGSIDVLQDATASELQRYLSQNRGELMLGVDLNESTSGLESSDSVGVATREITLSIVKTSGQYTFSDFFTNTTASILEAGADDSTEFYTMFGTPGSNQLTGGSSDFSAGAFDDVVRLQNGEAEGDILPASFNVSFLVTPGKSDNETSFDYSAGIEEFAILGSAGAAAIDDADLGISGATPTTMSFAVSSPTGSPRPWWFLILLVPAILVLRNRGGVA